MFGRLRNLYFLLTPRQRVELIRLQALVVVMAILELISVASIAPFMSVIGDIDSLQGNGLLARAYDYSTFQDPRQFVFWSGIFVIVAISIAAIVTAVTTWRLTVFGQRIGAEISSRLYSYYMQQDWPFHLQKNSSLLTSTIAHDCNRVTQLIIMPALTVNARIVLASIMGSAILLIDPLAGFLGLTIFGSIYLLLYITIRRRLTIFGREISESNTKRMRLMHEGFGGIKAIMISCRQKFFTTQFEKTSNTLSKANGLSQALAELPRSLIELLALGSMVLFVLYLLRTHDSDLSKVLPILSIYALAGFKLLPALQSIYNGVSTIRANLGAFDTVEEDLQKCDFQKQKTWDANKIAPSISRDIKLLDISYSHVNSVNPTINSLSITIPAGQTIGLVGPSGGGKSTLIDILLGLATPQQGQILIDDQPMGKFGVEAWQSNIGYVPQSIFLADASIKDNIAFGIEPHLVSGDRVKLVCEMANLTPLLESLPKGLDTPVGEYGEQLSGGQRQRIGIARALYDDPGVLIFDEATSALDGINEKVVMQSVSKLAAGRTIVLVAHRLNTLKDCNRIFVIDSGRVVESGTFDELSENSAVFREMGGLD